MEKRRVNSGSEAERGFSAITEGSTGSMPRARAGRESVTRLSHKSCTATRGGWWKLNRVARNSVTISPILQDSR